MDHLNITRPSFEAVDACSRSMEGEDLLQGHGLETKSLEPPLYFVPWITFDGVRHVGLQQSFESQCGSRVARFF
jgi:hypothetical protein